MAAFKTFKVKKLPGTEGIHPLILQGLPAETIVYITKLYKMCVLLGTDGKNVRLIIYQNQEKALIRLLKPGDRSTQWQMLKYP